jgi:dethiobiotin synthetase
VPRACFVTGTDTGVGKTVVAAALVASLAGRGVRVAARKPVVTGLDETSSREPPVTRGDLAGLADHELLGQLSGEPPERVAPVRFGPSVAPQLAAELADELLDPNAMLESIRAAASAAEAIVVEGVGGLLVPLGPGWDVRRLAGALAWPLIVVARPGLGTINHTLLTLEAARQASLDVRAVVLTPWPDDPGALELSNRAAIAALGAVEVATLPLLVPLTQSALAAAGDALPYERWLVA